MPKIIESEFTDKELKQKGFKTINSLSKDRIRIDVLPNDIVLFKTKRIHYVDSENELKLKQYLSLSKGEKKKLFFDSGKSNSKTYTLKQKGYKSFSEIIKNLDSKPCRISPEFTKYRVSGLYPPEVQEEILNWAKLSKIEKTEKTCLKKYGVKYSVESDLVKEKIASTCLKKYGVDNPFKLDSFQRKARETNRKNHDGLYNSQTQEWSELTKTKRKQLYLFDNILFDSSWELVYYFYLKSNHIPFAYHPCSIVYLEGEKEKIYEPDFKVLDRLVEIKGEHFFKNGKLYNPFSKEFLAEKQKCMENNNVLILKKEDIKLFFEYAKKHSFDYTKYKRGDLLKK